MAWTQSERPSVVTSIAAMRVEGEVERDTLDTFLPEITPEFKRGGVSGGLVHREVWNRLIAYRLADATLDYASGAGHRESGWRRRARACVASTRLRASSV